MILWREELRNFVSMNTNIEIYLVNNIYGHLNSLALPVETNLKTAPFYIVERSASSGPGDLMLGNSVPCGNPDSAPGEPERRLRIRSLSA